MHEPTWTEVWTTYGTWATAVTTLGLVVVGWWGLRQWRLTLEHQRADECISAARDLEGAIGRLITIRNGTAKTGYDPVQAAWRAYTQAWESWRRFNQAFSVARRYHKALPDDAPKAISQKLTELGGLIDANWAPDSVPKKFGWEVQQQSKRLLDKVVEGLTA